MKWKDLSFAMKLGGGFGIVLLLLCVVVGLNFTGVLEIEDNAGQVIDGNKLDANLAQKEVDHLNWVGRVNALLTDDQITELDVELDHRKCGFGKWLYGEGRAEALALAPSLEGTLKKVEEPHKKLHESAAHIKEVFRQADPELPRLLADKISDHLKWSIAVQNAMNSGAVKLGVQMDPTKCALGVWLGGEYARNLYEKGDAEFKQAWDMLTESHEKLHDSAAAIEENMAYDALRKADKAQDAAMAEVERIQDELFAVLDDGMENIVDPAKDKAAEFSDMETLTKWAEIDMVMNEDVVQNFLLAQYAAAKMRLLGDEERTRNCRTRMKTLREGMDEWLTLIKGTEMEGPGQTADGLLREWSRAVEKLQQVAVNARAAKYAVQTAETIYLEETTPILAETLTHLNTLKEEANHELGGMTRANGIYAAETLPALGQVQGLLNEIREEARESIMTDEILLNAAQSTRTTGIFVGAAAIVIGILLAWFMARAISGPVGKSKAFAETLADGDFTRSLDIEQKDEIGVLADAMNAISKNLGAMFRDISHNVETLSSSSTELSAISEQMSEGAGQTSGKSAAVAAAAEEMSTNMNSVAAAMEEASTNVSMVAAGAEEMTSTIGEIARNAEKARGITGRAVSRANN
ncbi:MAG: HAMP domain-containing protein, partial [Desulfobacterales bacterium]|nr:HAMP domain-containing protein [Desulfobacterales bacterium]